ncbi:MAG: MBL fold metallo-hydrolase [Candidatus Heimdallarchaeota archaeon]|nr:MBL fold metallo-hydrolase [Candidatus Heimdallarchaeota archaeon]
MSLTNKTKILISLGIILGVVVGIPAIIIPLNNYNSVTLTLLDNAGVMIEARGIRIYIDPINLPMNYSNKPADAILITHEHEDHYQFGSMSRIQKNDTLNVFPAYMTTPLLLFENTLAVVPEDQFQVGFIKITAFYMYTFAVPPYPASHPRENNYTSYIIDIDGFTIFHAGDSKNIQEYELIADQIDVALLPLGPGCQTMAGIEIIDVLDIIQPSFYIPIHFDTATYESFVLSFGHMIDCELIELKYFSSHKFKI